MKLDKSIFIQSILLILLLASCAPSHKVTFSWKNENFNIENPYKKIFLAALITNPHVRTHLEEEMSKAAIKKGFAVEKSLDYFPKTFNNEKPLDKEMMIDKIKELKCDLIFTITLIDKQSERRYITGMSDFHGPYPGYSLHFRGFYSYWYPYLYDPGYYVTDKTYFMEGNLFDGATETMIWSVQTETLNPSSIEKFSKDMVTLMLEKSVQDLKYKVQK